MAMHIVAYVEKLEKALIDLKNIAIKNGCGWGHRFDNVYEKERINEIIELVDEIKARERICARPNDGAYQHPCPKCGKIVQHFPYSKSMTCRKCKYVCKNPYYRAEDIEALFADESPKPHTKIRICFKEGGNQLPDLMIIKEEIINGMVDHAKVIYLEDKMTSEIIIDGSTHITEEKHIYPDLK